MPTPDSDLYIIPVTEGLPVQVRTTEDVTRRYERSVSSLSTKSQVYIVPFHALPPDFDFSSREVEVKGDYVILKDLAILEQCESTTYPNGVVNEAYEIQESYNPMYPNLYENAPPLNVNASVKEPYQRQSPYNPNFY